MSPSDAMLHVYCTPELESAIRSLPDDGAMHDDYWTADYEAQHEAAATIIRAVWAALKARDRQQGGDDAD